MPVSAGNLKIVTRWLHSMQTVRCFVSSGSVLSWLLKGEIISNHH